MIFIFLSGKNYSEINRLKDQWWQNEYLFMIIQKANVTILISLLRRCIIEYNPSWLFSYRCDWYQIVLHCYDEFTKVIKCEFNVLFLVVLLVHCTSQTISYYWIEFQKLLVLKILIIFFITLLILDMRACIRKIMQCFKSSWCLNANIPGFDFYIFMMATSDYMQIGIKFLAFPPWYW